MPGTRVASSCRPVTAVQRDVLPFPAKRGASERNGDCPAGTAALNDPAAGAAMETGLLRPTVTAAVSQDILFFPDPSGVCWDLFSTFVHIL